MINGGSSGCTLCFTASLFSSLFPWSHVAHTQADQQIRQAQYELIYGPIPPLAEQFGFDDHGDDGIVWPSEEEIYSSAEKTGR